MGLIEIDYIKELQNTTLAETRLYFVTRAHAQDDTPSLHIHELHYRGQITVQNCIGGHVNVLSDYKKM